MGRTYERIDDGLRAFIEKQHVFFTATAPLSADGHVNVSPKGLAGSFAVLDDRTVGYLDLGGSGAETIAHLRENGRVTLMWCAFDGPPRIVRIHGSGSPVFRDDPAWEALLPHFGEEMRARTDLRAVITVRANRISDTCGFAVPFMDHRAERPLHTERFRRETEESFAAYCEKKEHVGVSLDGLPALPLPLPPRTV
ncbi:pyridoxamine 5'-phosphate oxidase family protein [Streptomyces albidus (ex Kaewkla and Franco 2022)]|uniref:pyridoxamine 5'-phosphate oxidase family protein n=1 Tax=Streptomyces albidus (ex Kaewkla and Franco 2022) TaxID=722709 RepID=UPI0015EFA622|nr:pyridoxamine 5'-phosphate oxidase family protein [Streptomyces albidus (ex Kaewkla and Franco 2022)]